MWKFHEDNELKETMNASLRWLGNGWGFFFLNINEAEGMKHGMKSAWKKGAIAKAILAIYAI